MIFRTAWNYSRTSILAHAEDRVLFTMTQANSTPNNLLHITAFGKEAKGKFSSRAVGLRDARRCKWFRHQSLELSRSLRQPRRSSGDVISDSDRCLTQVRLGLCIITIGKKRLGIKLWRLHHVTVCLQLSSSMLLSFIHGPDYACFSIHIITSYRHVLASATIDSTATGTSNLIPCYSWPDPSLHEPPPLVATSTTSGLDGTRALSRGMNFSKHSHLALAGEYVAISLGLSFRARRALTWKRLGHIGF